MGKHEAGPTNGSTVNRDQNRTDVERAPDGFSAGSRTERPHDPNGWNPGR